MERLKDAICELVSNSEDATTREHFEELDNMGAEIIDCLDELQAYRTAEEQGLLLRLPCKVGSTLYQCHFINRQKIEREYKVIGLVFDIVRNVWLYEIAYQIGVEWRKTVCSFDAIGLTVFLTREEAEKALEDMKVKG